MPANAPSHATTAAGKARVIRGIIHRLLKGRLQGGDRLTEAEAAALFQVSRTPVREALVELASLGIAELKRNCGAILLPFGPKEVRDLYTVRSLLEVEAARLAASRMAEAEIHRLTAAFAELRREKRPDKNWQLDRELHRAVAEASGNPRLAVEIARYGGLVQTMREAVGSVVADIHDTSLAEHLRILRRLKECDSDGAAAAMRKHLVQAAASAEEAISKPSRTLVSK